MAFSGAHPADEASSHVNGMRLSICIPTYNRADYLPELLDSILAQTSYGCDLEVVVSDNASTDDTPAVVERYRERFSRFVYHRAETNQGADRNFLKVVAVATGDFCWLMGSDDRLEPGGLAAVERALLDHPDAGGVFVRNTSYDATMSVKTPTPLGINLPDKSCVLVGADHAFYAVGEYVGYISANVVDRKLWEEVVSGGELEQYFNAWIHVYVIGSMMQRRQEWVYVAQPCVAWRSGNDSFLVDGQYRRLEIDVAGYETILRGLFGTGSHVYRHIMLRILRHARFRILYVRAHPGSSEFIRQARALMVHYYRTYPQFWIKVYPLLLAPTPAIRMVRTVYRRMIRSRSSTVAIGRRRV